MVSGTRDVACIVSAHRGTPDGGGPGEGRLAVTVYELSTSESPMPEIEAGPPHAKGEARADERNKNERSWWLSRVRLRARNFFDRI